MIDVCGRPWRISAGIDCLLSDAFILTVPVFDNEARLSRILSAFAPAIRLNSSPSQTLYTVNLALKLSPRSLMGSDVDPLVLFEVLAKWLHLRSHCRHAGKRAFLLGYVKGICGLGPSPKYFLTGGTTTCQGPRQCLLACWVQRVNHTMTTGPMPPRTMLQKMAGFCRAAQLMYVRGASKNWTGAIE